jgi:hypothetical protein
MCCAEKIRECQLSNNRVSKSPPPNLTKDPEFLSENLNSTQRRAGNPPGTPADREFEALRIRDFEELNSTLVG